LEYIEIIFLLLGLSWSKEIVEMSFDSKAWLERGDGSIGLDGCLASAYSSFPHTSPGGFH
jgi:hypothetical protein